jgi:hypothetical protein
LGVRILELPGLSVKGDFTDWLADGGTPDRLRVLAHACPVWTPEAAPMAPTEADRGRRSQATELVWFHRTWHQTS